MQNLDLYSELRRFFNVFILLLNVPKKDILKNSLVEGGHAEIEDDTILFIYGNAYEIVLSNATF